MEVVPQRLIELAQQCLGASQALTGVGATAQPALQVDAGAAGNTPGGPRLIQRHTTLAEAAGSAVDRLAGVLEQDFDALLACAFDVSNTDQTQADRYQVGQLPDILLPHTEGAA